MWLFTIARNLLLNARRATRRRRSATDRLRRELEQSRAGTDTADTLAVRDAVKQLPADLRELVELVRWDGFSLVEAARITGITASTARSRYAAAKGRMPVSYTHLT